jgi:hypothetical protein
MALNDIQNVAVDKMIDQLNDIEAQVDAIRAEIEAENEEEENENVNETIQFLEDAIIQIEGCRSALQSAK